MRVVLTVLFAAASLAALASPAYAKLGQRFPSEKRIVADAVTGRPLTLLTNGVISESKLYPTDQQWAFDGKHIIFRSSRATGEGGQVFAVNEQTGDIIQLTEGTGLNSSVMVSRSANKITYLRRGADGRTTISSLDLTALIADAMAGRVTTNKYETLHATLPADFRPSGFTVDADGQTAYIGYSDYVATPGTTRPPGVLSALGKDAATYTTRIPAVRLNPIAQSPGGIIAVNLSNGATHTVVKTDFNVGHLQANPFKPGELMYCKETGEDADTRMWIVNRDGTGARPAYTEAPGDWVTHEQFADADHVIFNMMGFTKMLRQRPSGLTIVNLRDGTMDIIGDVPMKDTAVPNPQWKGVNSLWHNAVSYDGRYAGGDDFDGNIWLIDRRTRKQTLLSTGHFMAPDHQHPSFSPDGERVLIQSGMLTGGERLSLIVMPSDPDWKK